jgi:phage tail-like protein
MDANGTRYHLLLGRDDWDRCQLDGLDWDQTNQSVSLKTKTFEFKAAPSDAPVKLEDRRGAGVDRFGNVFWIAPDRQEILVLSSGTDATSHFWSNMDTQPETETLLGGFNTCQPRGVAPQIYAGLAITEDHFLVVGTQEPVGLLVFDLHAGGAPRVVQFLDDSLRVLDLCARPGGGVWMLEGTPEQPKLRGLNRDFQWLSPPNMNTEPDDLFQPSSGLLKRKTVQPQMPLAFAVKPGAIAIKALRQDEILILERADIPLVRHLRFGETEGRVLKLELEGLKIIPHDFVFMREQNAFNSQDERLLGLIFVADASGNQTFVFHLLEKRFGGLRLEALKRFLPMRRFLGKALIGAPTLAKDHCQTGVLYDFGDTWLPLVEQPQKHYGLSGGLVTPLKWKTEQGQSDHGFLDGKEPDCVWHRLMLEGSFPPEAGVRVWSRASDDLGLLTQEQIPWQAEPNPIRRSDGSELPFSSKPQDPNAAVLELLFQRAQGRYLQLKLEFTGNGRSSPKLKALRAYYPRFSYAKAYLPTVYREDRASADFLERMLANVEGFFTTIEDRIAAAQILFDPQSAPQETLDWLAAWFGVALDPNWDDTKRRIFIAHAFEFFRWRGTAHGLSMALRLTLEDCFTPSIFESDTQTFGVRVIERFRSRDAKQSTQTAHRFRVLLPVKPGSSGNDEDNRSRLEIARRVIELHKPAHTSFDLQFYWAMFRLGEARLGAETLIDQGSRDPRLMPPLNVGQGHLLEGYLAPRHPYNVPDRQVLGRDRLG